ncbi:hypothetical protein N9731_00170 [Gammaproteobacteria bacterium]|nr:hypothetical protein [Gammaproteobacteria bacterium]
MSTHKFNHTWIEKLPYSSKRKLYIDSTINTKFTNCDFILMVGARTKTAYLRYRPIQNGKRKTVLKKIGDAKVIPLADLKDAYTKEALQILSKDSPILTEKETRNMTIGHLIDFYIKDKEAKKKNVSDKANMLSLKNQPYLKSTVGNLKCSEQDVFTIKDLIQLDADNEKFYVANMKREFIQRVWNYSLKNNREYNKILKTISNPASFSMDEWIGWKKEPSSVVLHEEDYKEFFETVNTIDRSDFRDLLYMFLFTGQHPYSEVAKMRWNQIKKINGQYWWFMEKGFHKTAKEHQFPLHKMAMNIINKYKDNDDVYVFKNLHDKSELHDKNTFKNVLRRLRNSHNITWDIRCLRASFVTTITNIDNEFRAGILCNQAGQNITEKNYVRANKIGITYTDFKVDMINAYMEVIQDKLDEVSK